MKEFKLSRHQVIARELFGERKSSYAMESADVYQSLARFVIGIDDASNDDVRNLAYTLGYQAQLVDATTNSHAILDTLANQASKLILLHPND